MTDTQRFAHEVIENLTTNILPYWMEQMVDEEHGGFYGRRDNANRLDPEAPKGAILNARILWAFSAAYRVLRRPEYLAVATRAKRYVLDHFVDHEFGGVYWSLSPDGKPLDTKKQFYAIGFAIYGLSEYARATGDDEALMAAAGLYDDIEAHAVDHSNGGYIEATTRDWQQIGDMRLSELDANFPKSQNTHLHIIEPYTNLLRAVRERNESRRPSADHNTSPLDAARLSALDIRLSDSLRSLLDIFTRRILNPETHHLDLFFEMDWTRGAGRLESYGHDIECSWLMHETALVLGDADVLASVEPIVIQVAQASAKGLRPDGSMIHEANLDTGHVDDDLHWWVQAENVVGWLNAAQLLDKYRTLNVDINAPFTADAAMARSWQCWEYIKRNLVDTEHGEWHWSRHPDGSLNTVDDHAGFWKCPYHNTRMCLEVYERLGASYS